MLAAGPSIVAPQLQRRSLQQMPQQNHFPELSLTLLTHTSEAFFSGLVCGHGDIFKAFASTFPSILDQVLRELPTIIDWVVQQWEHNIETMLEAVLCAGDRSHQQYEAVEAAAKTLAEIANTVVHAFFSTEVGVIFSQTLENLGLLRYD